MSSVEMGGPSVLPVGAAVGGGDREKGDRGSVGKIQQNSGGGGGGQRHPGLSEFKRMQIKRIF